MNGLLSGFLETLEPEQAEQAVETALEALPLPDDWQEIGRLVIGLLVAIADKLTDGDLNNEF